jgi:DNA-binding XRE family transcriptional regulator
VIGLCHAVPTAKRKWRSDARASPQVEKALRRLGKQIRTLRRSAGLTQESAAERAKLDYKHYQAIEGGSSNVTVASLIGIAKALKVKPAELFEGV